MCAAASGPSSKARQKYKIIQGMAGSDRVALEVEWEGTLAIPFGSTPAGGRKRANIAEFMEFREGRIAGERDYRLLRGMVSESR